MTSFSIQNFGCRVNQAEAFDWTSEFQRRGLAFEPDALRSGIIVLNSCTLTSRADRDVRKFIRHVARKNPQARIVVTGCLAERAPAEMAALPGVWKVVPNSDKESLPRAILDEFPSERGAILKNVLAKGLPKHRDAFQTHPLCPLPTAPSSRGGSRKASLDCGTEGGPTLWGEPAGGPSERGAIAERSFRRRAFLKVQDGCGMSCAFCVIPSVRGKSRSVPPDVVPGRRRGFSARGFREAILAGIHLSSYGRDLERRSSLLELLREIEAVPGRLRVR